MKSLMLLWKMLAKDLASGCFTSTTIDCKTVEWRVKHEGIQFLTISLPNFGKDFEKSLDQGYLSRQDFQGFSWKSGLPVFLQGFLGLVFDPSSGRLLDSPNIEAIQAVRQLTLLYSKMFLLTNSKRERAAMDGYIKCEQEVRDASFSMSYSARSDLRRVSNIVLGRVLSDIDRKVINSDYLVPSHGPGATADGLKGNRKYSRMSWPVRLDGVFPSVDFILPNASYYEELEGVDFLEPEAEIPVKVISVPKTQKTPRIIAMEPTAMQFAQQAVRRLVYDSVERDNLLNALIGFNDQTPNQGLALIGSSDGSLATLDLSEASDRVSFEHVRELLAFTPHLFEVVDACRSRKALVPGHGEISLAKFASMGSALSFPIEAMVFISIIFIGIERALNRPLTRQDVELLQGKVRVFGDDIIVPVDYVIPVIDALEDFGLKVNRGKSFWTGLFRESCGKEYYAGQDVSIVKVRQMPPSNREHVRELVSWVSTSNQLFKAGNWQTVKWLDSMISGILKDYPVVLETSPVLGRHSFMGFVAQKTGGRYQIPLVKGYVIRSVLPKDPLDEHFALHKFFLQRGEMPNADEKHLERAGRPLVVNIKRGWNSAI
jgi:hypothetical protein